MKTSIRSGYFLSLATIGVLYFILGFFTWLNGALIPFLKLVCHLESNGQALLVTFAFYIAYLLLAVPSSFILRVTGFKNGMSLALIIMVAGALVFIPAAITRSFGLFLSGLFVQGMGLALLQTAINPYIAVIGPMESAAKRISIMGVCNKVAGALSPMILSAILLHGANEIEAKVAGAAGAADRDALLKELAHRIITPYGILALVLLLVAVLIRFSHLPDIEPDETSAESREGRRTRTSAFQFPHLLLGVLALFLYVGVEVMAGDVLPLYASSSGMSLERSSHLTSYTMFAMLIGYLVGIACIPRLMSQEAALKISAIAGVTMTGCAFFAQGMASVVFVALLGLANALMWPAIFPLAISGLGKFTKIGAAFLIMGVAGGAILPKVYAELAEIIPFKAAFLVCTAPAYFYIWYYAVSGCRAGLAGNSAIAALGHSEEKDFSSASRTGGE